jgi:Leucine-rich repeat (LRR) protein
MTLGACQNYDITLNERVIYTPDPLFENYLIPDDALRHCLIATIETYKITAAVQLVELNCSFAGIANLEGLATFTGLVRLRLSSNEIVNLVELGKLTELRELQLDDNRIIDPVPLEKLSHLRDLDISGNPALQCPGNKLPKQLTLRLPDHCT